MEKIKVAIIGYGNIGEHALDSINEAADMELTGIVVKSKYLDKVKDKYNNINVVDGIEKLPKTDVALLCIPSVIIPEESEKFLKLGISTVDSYDIHGDNMVNMIKKLDNSAKINKAVSICGAGWDPGTDSTIRAIFEIMVPKGLTYTNFGPGMSMGHTVEVKKIEGVKKALSVTTPKGLGLHKRIVYVEINEGANFTKVEKDIKENPYFMKDETYVIEVSDVESLMDNGHGVLMERKGVAGKTHNQRMEYSHTVTNPAATAQVMVSSARAATKCQPGAYTMIDVPLMYFLPGDRFETIKRMV